MSLKIIPEAISIRSSGMVSNENIVWVSYPEACRSLISVEQAPRSLGLDDQVILDVVVGLNSILNKHSVALDFVSNVIFKPQVVSSVKGKSSVVTLMSSKSFSV